MADTITSTSTFEVGLEFKDNDGSTQRATIKIPNPKSNIDLRQAITSVFRGYTAIGFNDNNNSFHNVESDMIVTGSTTNETVRIIDIGVAD